MQTTKRKIDYTPLFGYVPMAMGAVGIMHAVGIL